MKIVHNSDVADFGEYKCALVIRLDESATSASGVTFEKGQKLLWLSTEVPTGEAELRDAIICGEGEDLPLSALKCTLLELHFEGDPQ